MLGARVIRLLLAGLVAMWSPAWCCCSFAGGAAPGPAVVQRNHTAHSEHGHDHDKPIAAGHGHDQPCSDHGSDGRCGCESHDRRANLTPAIEAPSLDLTGWAGWFAPGLLPVSTDATMVHLNGRWRTSAEQSAGTVRAQTLFARRCLLLI